MSVEMFLDLDDNALQELVGLGGAYCVEVSSNRSFANNSPIVQVEPDDEVELDLTKVDTLAKFHDKEFHRDDI